MCKFPLPIDSELSLTFRLYPTEPAITCRAKVMFSRVGLGMGIQLLDLSAEALPDAPEICATKWARSCHLSAGSRLLTQ